MLNLMDRKNKTNNIHFTCVPFGVWFVQRVFRHTLQKQLKYGSSIFFPIMAKYMHRWLTPGWKLILEESLIIFIMVKLLQVDFLN